MYDIIGDIHGQAGELIHLLEKLGYQSKEGVYSHNTRKAIFLGDFIDRGLTHLRVIDIVRPMVEKEHALAVMGNHEYNAICFQTDDPNKPGCWLRPRVIKNILQHVEFLKAYAGNLKRLDEDIAWFKTLPLWLDLSLNLGTNRDSSKLRIIHACWDDMLIAKVKTELGDDALLSEAFLINSADKNHWAYDAVETLLKGKEIPLPNGCSFNDKDGHPRDHIRTRWWCNQGKGEQAPTYRDIFMGPDDVLDNIPDIPIEESSSFEYSTDNPPVFVGHYWMTGKPKPLAPNIACVDYSVAREGGYLTAYRWNGEQQLCEEHFVSVPRVEK